jgi:sigma-B regulation protein RsbQ
LHFVLFVIPLSHTLAANPLQQPLTHDKHFMSITKRNNVRISGKGKTPVMFAHGFGYDQSMWRFIAPDFEQNYKVVLFDYAGHGKSTPDSYDKIKYNSLDGYAQDILGIIDDQKLQDVILVAHSVSNMIAILAANKRPASFKCLVMIGASARYINDKDYTGGFEKKDLEGMLSAMDHDYKGWVHFISAATMQNPGRPELTEELEKTFMAADPKVFRQFAEVTFYSDIREEVKKLQLPVLILQCEGDIVAPKPAGEYLHKNISKSTLIEVNASGHCPHMSAPRETSAAIREYLGKIG